MNQLRRVALFEAGSPGLNIFSHVAMGRGVPLLATVLAQHQLEVRAFIEDVGGEESIDWDWVAEADVVGFSTITCTLPRSTELMRRVRAINSRAVIVFGGPESTCAPVRSLDAGADYVLRGECELSLPTLLEVLSGEGRPDPSRLEAVPGLVWRDSDGLHEGPPPVQLSREHLNALPLVDQSLVASSDTATTSSVWRSRGCPEQCEFCEVHQIWPRYALRDESKSVSELLQAQARGRGGVFLIDDNCAANKPSFKRFLREAIARGYHTPLVVQLRAEAVLDGNGRPDHELLGLLRQVASVTTLCVGIESASDEDLRLINKRQDSARVSKALRAITRSGLLVHGMMIAFADDTLDTLKRNGALARRYVTSLQYLFEVPLPGTPLTRKYEDAGRILWHEMGDLSYFDGMHIAIRPSRVSAEVMQAAVIREYKRFYSRFRMLSTFISGLLLRHRRLSPAELSYCRQFNGLRRMREWARLHLEHKLAPSVIARIGRRRVLEVLRDPGYREYLERLRHHPEADSLAGATYRDAAETNRAGARGSSGAGLVPGE